MRPIGAGRVIEGGSEVLRLQPVEPLAVFRATSFPGGSGIGGRTKRLVPGVGAALSEHMRSLPTQGCFLAGPEPKELNFSPGESS